MEQMMMDLISFQQAIDDSEKYSKRHLILGNGFSIGCRADIFHYASLFEEADFSSIAVAKSVFSALKTQDFEVVIRSLEDSSQITPLYIANSEGAARDMRHHASALKNLLVETIANNHPARPVDIADQKFWACRNFLRNFLQEENGGQVYTLNYDLLLYWTLMHEDMPFSADAPKLRMNDGFGNIEDDFESDYVVWQGETGANKQCVHYVHGALHLFDAGHELKKYTWKRRGIPLVEQARQAIQSKEYPLFVAEGLSTQKKNKIRHNAYLYHSYKSLVSNAQQAKPCFFVYGHSLAENDKHILDELSKGKFPMLYVGIYGDPNLTTNKVIIRKANALAISRGNKYPLQVKFYDSTSANVWGDATS